MATAIVSDLHLGAASKRDLLRHETVLGKLVEALGDVDELVLLGDVVELREGPADRAIAVALPVLEEIDRAMAGRRVTLVAGNHDHQLARPLVEAARLDGRRLELQTLAEPSGDGPLGAVARAFVNSELQVAYPGVRVRDDVYATHGHYLDVHNTVPSFERLAIGVIQRVTASFPDGAATPEDYEAVLSPVYAFIYALAQAAHNGRGHVPQDRSVKIWDLIAGDGSRTMRGRLLGGVAVPTLVRALNATGLGPLRADLSGQELRRAALSGMHTALGRLAIDAPHVVFGHTHRSGPHPGDAGWGPLINSGSWIHEPSFLGERPRESPYWPGHIVLVPDGDGPPELRCVLDELPSGT